MSASLNAVETLHSAAVPRLLVELPSRSRVFWGNLRDLILPRRLPPLELESTPADFWPDVFVQRSLPWSRFFQSAIYHALAGALLIGFTHLFMLQPRVVTSSTFDHSQVVYYRASEYLPPLDTREASEPQPAKADPEFSPQPIISVPPEADNRSQTIVTPPNIKLKQDVALPNIVSWANDVKKPRLAIPDAPLTPAADITRLGPKLENSVVTPPPDAARLAESRNAQALENSVVAPPPDLHASNSNSAFQGLQPTLIAPPPVVDRSATRPLGDLTIAPSAVIAPAPQLPVAEQRSMAGGRIAASAAGIQQVVPPPPPVSGSGSSESFGSRGRVIALNLHPAVNAPPDPPAGNRRGSFAATPEGHPGASGSPGSTSAVVSAGTTAQSGKGKGTGTGSSGIGSTELPAGLYVGSTNRKTSPVAGDASGNNPAVNPNLIASARPPRVSSAPARPSESVSTLSEPERAVFAGRRFYSLTLNMPNLNSAGGSWVIRFAEIKNESGSRDGNSPAADLSQPTATRKVDPAYPLQMMRENVAGTVIVYAVIRADGSVGNVRVLRGVDERLDRFAREAVAQWKFAPATKNGSPVDVEATFQIPFRPAHVGTNF
jgi:TonB family protein